MVTHTQTHKRAQCGCSPAVSHGSACHHGLTSCPRSSQRRTQHPRSIMQLRHPSTNGRTPREVALSEFDHVWQESLRDPHMCHAVHVHGKLVLQITALQKVRPGHHTSVVDDHTHMLAPPVQQRHQAQFSLRLQVCQPRRKWFGVRVCGCAPRRVNHARHNMRANHFRKHSPTQAFVNARTLARYAHHRCNTNSRFDRHSPYLAWHSALARSAAL
jgi:hypothetical protein